MPHAPHPALSPPMAAAPLPCAQPPHLQTDFLSPEHAAALVARTGVIACLRGMAEAVEQAFMRWQEFNKSARTAHHSAEGVIELMPVSDGRDYAFKYVNGHPVNTRHALPTVMAFGALASVATGQPVFLSELTLTTALRTAATSAMVARRLMRPGSRTMALIGNGSQAEFQALAFHGLLGIRRLRIFDLDPAAMHKLARNLQPYALEVVHCTSAADAVRAAEVVTTVTADKACATILSADMLRPGLHVNAVGGDCPGKTELDAQVLWNSDVFVEFEPQTRIEGELQQMPPDFPVTEFWRVLRGEAPGRTSPEQITVFDSVGFALEDYAAMRYMHARAAAQDLLEPLALIPDLQDPKDLFALLSPAASHAAPPTRKEPACAAPSR